MPRDRTVQDIRGSLRAVSYAASEHALSAYDAELARMPAAVADVVRKSAVDVAGIARQSRSRARAVVDELVGKIVTEYQLDGDRPASVAERDQADQLAARIAGSPLGRNSEQDLHTSRRMARARAAVDSELAGADVPWRQ